MTRAKALEGFKCLYKDIDKDNHLFVGTINPEFIKIAIKSLEAWDDVFDKLSIKSIQAAERDEFESEQDIQMCIDVIKACLQGVEQ